MPQVDFGLELLEAAGQGSEEKVREVLNQYPHLLMYSDPYGHTAAHIAAFYGHLDILSYLSSLNNECLFSESFDLFTPAHSAAANGQREILEFLSKKSLSHLFAKDCDGWTVAHIAAFYGHENVLRFMAEVAPSVFGINAELLRMIARTASCKNEIEKVQKLDFQYYKPHQESLGEGIVISTSSSILSSESVDSHHLLKGRKIPFGGAANRDEDESSTSSMDARKCHKQSLTNGKKNHSPPHERKLTRSPSWVQDVTTREQQSSWKTLLGGLRKGSDITSMLIPAEFLRPESTLERIQDVMQHGRHLESIVLPNSSALDRIKSVVRFHVSGVIRAIFDGKKPYNPILGETCVWAYKHGDSSCVTKVVCEQVSHHPPISAFFLNNERLGINITASAEINPTFTGNCVLVPFKGKRVLKIMHLNEEYTMTVPSLQYRGLFVGSRGAEWVGKVVVKCEQTGLSAKLNFKPLGWLGMWGSWHRVEGKVKSKVKGVKKLIGSIYGHWDTQLIYRDEESKEEEVMYDFDQSAKFFGVEQVKMKKASLPTDSLVVWSRLSAALTRRDMKDANRIKNEIEEEQRRIRKERAKRNQAYQPRFFRFKEGRWVPRDEMYQFQATCMVGTDV
mmetsp:Transcript_10728/g.35967  ORF Transcript_10728/g.35967 Transcript_10728/m.35967 type:complete len:620 (-) Transcript_10728:2083-3942(-)